MKSFKQLMEEFKNGDTVWAKKKMSSGTTSAGHVVHSDDSHVWVRHKADGRVYKHTHDQVSDDFEKLNPNPYKK